MEDFTQFKQLFLDEATTLLSSLEEVLLSLEQNPENLGKVDEVFRVMHTLKGVGGMYGFNKISEFTHNLENIYDQIRQGNITVDSEILDLTLASVDHLTQLLSDQELANPDNIQKHNLLSSRIADFMNSTSVKMGNGHTWSKKKKIEGQEFTYLILFTFTPEILDKKVNLLNVFKDISAVGQIKNIKAISAEGEKEQWSIFLVTTGGFDDIEDAVMFVWEYCIITKVADFNIFIEDDFNKNLTIYQVPDENIDELSEIENIIDENISSIHPTTKIETEHNTTVDSIRKNITRISVDSSKLDYLMYLVSELITINSQLVLQTKGKAFDSIRTQIEQVDKLSKLFRNNALDIRLIPLKDVLPKFQRLVRDVSKQLGKDVDLICTGAETELDKNSVDIIVEPLLHIIRNSLDHGIELPDIRADRGKSPKGTITINAYHSGNNIYIEVSDDGNGIDKSKVLKKAIERGLVKAEDTLTDKEIFDLICQPGFSTVDAVTNLSGRGVGMDVVKKKIAEIRGEFEITSEKEKGTKFIIKLQQSVAILDTLLVRSDAVKYLLPVTDVEVCQQIPHKELIEREKIGTIPYGGNLVPFVTLTKGFLNEGRGKMVRMVIINKNNHRFAVAVDEIVGQHQAVLKSIGSALNKQKNISAASLLGNGEVAFLLDPAQLWQNIV